MLSIHRFLCFCLAVLLLCTPISEARAMSFQQRSAELRALRNRAQQILQKSPETAVYIRRLLVLSAGTAAMAALTELAQQRMWQTVSSAKSHSRLFPEKGLAERSPARHLFAKRRSWGLIDDLFDLPPTASHGQKDLSWLDKPSQPLAPRPAQPSLFDEPVKEIKPKTFLSKYIMENYRPRISRLPLSEQQGLIEVLDEAVLRKQKSGRQNALKFLEQKAFQSSSTSLYLVIAKRMLVVTGILAVTDLLVSSSFSDKTMERLAANPALFLDATDEQLHRLARYPQALSYCRQIVQAVELLAATPLTEEEKSLLTRPAYSSYPRRPLRAR